ncbi:MAG: ABC transporter permease [Acidobacteria bacterium]|nr:ABC transporter permease [Acidobacteriota bacterium]
MRRLSAIVRREFSQLRRDKLTLAGAFAIPLVMIILYGTVLTANIKNLGLVIEDLDQTPSSRRYAEAFAATNKFNILPVTANIEKLIESGIARAALRIPANFERDLKSRRSPEVQLLIDGTESNSATLIRGINTRVAATFQPVPSPGRYRTPPVALHIRHWYNPGLKDDIFFGSGALGLVLILFPALLGAISASREMDLGTITQAYACKLTATHWILGKALPFFFLGMIQLFVCFALGLFVFAYPLPGHPAVFLAGGAIYILTAVLYGLMVGNLTGSQSAAIQAIQFGAFILSLMLSGFFMPIQNIPPGLRWISNLVPARHFIEITRDVVLRGGDWSTSFKPLLSLLALALFFYFVSFRRMRRMHFNL